MSGILNIAVLSFFVGLCGAQRRYVIYCAHPALVPNAQCFDYDGIPGPDDDSLPVVDGLRNNLVSTSKIYRAGDRVRYQCLAGFTRSGPAVVNCLSTGNWSTLPKCVPARAIPTPVPGRCSSTPTIANGRCVLLPPGSSKVAMSSSQRPTTTTTTRGTTTTTTMRTTTEELNTTPEELTTTPEYEYDGDDSYDLYGDSEDDSDDTQGDSSDSESVTQELTGLRVMVLGWESLASRATARNIAATKTLAPRRTATTAGVIIRTNPSVRTIRRLETTTTARTIRTTTTTRKLQTTMQVGSNERAYKCSCDDGYQMTGNSLVSCPSGAVTWSPLPRCESPPNAKIVESCQALPVIPGARCRKLSQGLQAGSWIELGQQKQGIASLDGEVYQVYDVYDCVCNDGFAQESGSTAMVCLPGGDWSNKPICTPITTVAPTVYCLPREIPNADCFEVDEAASRSVQALIPVVFQGLQKTMIKAGNKIVFKCNEGFEMVGSPDVTCSARGNWSAFPTCAPKQCTNAPSIADGICVKLAARSNVSDDIFAIGERALCSCDPGKMMPSGTLPLVTCLSRERWTATLPRCIDAPTTTPAPTCALPPKIDGAGCDCPDDDLDPSTIFQVGDTVTITCKSGYVLGGNPIITCQRNGQWSRSPSCTEVVTQKPKNCQPPRDVPNAYCRCQDSVGGNGPALFDIGDQVRFTCNQGYRIRGTGIITCTASGFWSTYPVCIPSK